MPASFADLEELELRAQAQVKTAWDDNPGLSVRELMRKVFLA